MPKQVVFSLFLEVVFIFITSILLVQPGWIFTNKNPKVSRIAHVGGMIFLCLTFCWSVILGCVLTLNQRVIRF